jgi:hypothetical protein
MTTTSHPPTPSREALAGKALDPGALRAKVAGYFGMSAEEQAAALDEIDQLRAALRELVEAWESLPGPKRYSYERIQGWLVHDMAPMVKRARAALGEPR